MKQIIAIAITAIIAATAATAGGRSTDLPDVSYRMQIPTGVEYKVKGPFLLEGTNIWSVFKIDGRGRQFGKVRWVSFPPAAGAKG
jgi:hypothetical protein